MTAVELLQVCAQVTWVVLGAVAIRWAWRRPSPTGRDVALFFGTIALITIEGRVTALVHQLVDNLIENALKYSPPESPVRVRAASEGASAHIAVSDDGIGIPAEDIPHVFDRFRRGSNVDHRRYAGIGLGLYICRGIAEQHGGRIWVESEAGRGTTFHVSVPLAGS